MPQPALNREWARLGAIARLQQIQKEVAEIYAAFPDLKRGGATLSVPSPTGRFKKKRSISPAGRKAMSEGMRKYWARRKAAAKAAQKK